MTARGLLKKENHFVLESPEKVIMFFGGHISVHFFVNVMLKNKEDMMKRILVPILLLAVLAFGRTAGPVQTPSGRAFQTARHNINNLTMVITNKGIKMKRVITVVYGGAFRVTLLLGVIFTGQVLGLARSPKRVIP